MSGDLPTLPEGDPDRLELLERVLATLDDVLIITEALPLDEPGPRVVYVNEAFTAMTGWQAADVLGRSPRMLQGPGTDSAVRVRLRRALEAGVPIRTELLNYRKDGSPFWVELHILPMLDEQGVVRRFVSVQRETTARKQAERELERQATHSEVTGLLNRSAFIAEIDRTLSVFAGPGPPPALVLFDVQGLRDINHALGREVGDRVLVEVAARLSRLAEHVAVTAQLSGGEFGLLICEAPAGRVVSLCERIARSLLAPLLIGQEELTLVVTGGVAMSGASSTSGSLLREAEMARRAVQPSGSGGYEFYDPSMGEAVERRMDLDRGLRRAIAAGELLLHHQPVVGLSDGVARYAEALVRWDRGGSGLVSPLSFIPAAEESGAILPVGAWVLAQACHEAVSWQADLPGVGVAVNLSARQLADPDLFSDVDRALDTGLLPRLLTLEVTEGALIADPEAAARTLQRLRSRGMKMALDDFGTGYSSLAYLKRLPVDTVKIDKTFVDGVEGDPGDRAIVRAVLALAGELSLEVVAEGVETQGQRRALLELGCQWAQGYLFARPTGAAALAGACAQSRATAGTR